MVRSLGEVATSARCSAIVCVEYGKAMLSQKLIEEKALASPDIFNGLNSGAAVRIEDEGNAGGLSFVLRQQESGVQNCSVTGFDFKLLRSAEVKRLHSAGGPEGMTGA